MKRIMIIVWMAAAIRGYAQPDCFAEVSLDRHSVYVRQPLKVTITVLTATWYTTPLEFDQIQLPNAFILQFDQTTPGMFDHGGKQYAGLQFYFIVFPYQEGEFVFPSIGIIAHTPAPGSSKSNKVSISTAAQHFSVRPVPGGRTADWLVAKNVVVSEQWSRSLGDLKVGDIIERTVTVRAAGTLPQFIPELSGEPVDFATVYLRDPVLKDERDEYDAGGRLTQRIVYLLTKEGDFALPAVRQTWWNPNSSKLYTRSAAGAAIHVKANANLGMLTTLRDSLGATHPKAHAAGPIRRRTIFGVAWYWALLILLAGTLLLYRLTLLLIRIRKNYILRHAAWLAGERYAFRRFMRARLTDRSLISAMYAWWDRLPQPPLSFSIIGALRRGRYAELGKKIAECLRLFYSDGKGNIGADPAIKRALKVFRKIRGKVAFDPKCGVSPQQSTTGSFSNFV